MFAVRTEQFAALNKSAETDFLLRLHKHIRKKFPDVEVRVAKNGQQIVTRVSQISERALSVLIGSALRRARRHQLTWQSSLTAFVSAMFVCAPNFDEHPAIGAYFVATRFNPNERLLDAAQCLPASIWHEAGAKYRPESWTES